MSPITAADFSLLSPAVFLLVFRKRWADLASQVLTLCSAALSIFGILDFVLDANSSHTYISPITALVLLLFSFGVLLSRTESGVSALIASRTSAGRLTRRLLPAAIAIPIGIAWVRWHLQLAGYLSEWTGLTSMTVAGVVLLCAVTAWTALANERATAEELNARESARRLASIVNSSIDAIIGETFDGIVTSWNPGAEAIYGYSAEEMVGENAIRVIPPDRREEYEGSLRRVREGECIRLYETARTRKDGKTIFVSLSIGSIRDTKGKIVGAFTIARDISEKKRAEAALAAERRRFEAVLDSLPVMICLLRPDYSVAFANRSFRKQFGDPGEQKCYELCFGKTAPCEFCKSFEVFKSGQPIDWEVVTNDGRMIHAFDFPFVDSDGSPLVLEMDVDITDRKRAELALDRSERRYRSLVTATTQIVWTTNPQGEVVDDMPMWRAFAGMSQEQLLGWGWIDSLHPDDRERTAEIWNQALRKQSQYDAEYRIRRHDGEYRTMAVRGVPVLDAGGSIREWVGTCTDITDRKRTEQALQMERQRFRDVLDKLPAYVVLLTPDYHVAFDNTVFRERFGKSEGRPCYEYLFGRSEPRENGETCKVLQTGAPQRWKWTGPDGRHYDVFDFPFPDTDGSPLILEMGLDVTDRLKAEDEVRRLNAELEQRVVQRTAQLQAANKELEAFTYSVSHDLRAPLRHISGFSNILAEEYAAGLPSEAKHHVQRIQEGTRRMGQLVDDLLNLGRVGRREPVLQVAGLRSIVDEVIGGLNLEAGERSVEWKIGELPYVECDTALMQQVFQNLLSNALKFTRPRKRAVIEVGQEQRDGETVICVRDNGVGFSMKYADKLFGVFQRLHRAEDFEGTGVGLATVQRIIQKHGGRIWAEAELDKGASFYFTLGSSEARVEKTESTTAGGD
jgi:PAS domain S-box-containing protein